jgi:NAD(P)-dependent dehydrogenase (short-subunit alcohol dehydrogenase family)
MHRRPGPTPRAGQKLIAELHAVDAEADFIRADVRHEDDVRKLVDQTVARFRRLDVAVNNAGTEGKPGPFIEQTSDNYAATFDTNVLGNRFDDIEKLRSKISSEFGPWTRKPRATVPPNGLFRLD